MAAATADKNNRRIVVALLLVALSLSAQLAPAAACPYCPTPKPPPPPPPPKVKPPPSSVPCPPPPYAPVTPTPSTGKCPINTLKLLACVDAINSLVHAVVGGKASEACCPLLAGVADLDAALCLCTTIKASALSVSLVLPVAIEVLVNECGKHVPSSFECPS